MEQKMTERAQKIMRAYEAEDTYNFPKDGVAAAIREVINQLQQETIVGPVITCYDVMVRHKYPV
jgi:hypothetical protein